MDWIPLFGALGVGGLGGTLLSQVMTGHREKAARAVAFRKQQLEQFYGPQLAMHKEIRARSELRVKLQKAIDTGHIEDMLKAGPGKTEAASDPHIGVIAKNIQDENATFRDVLMPCYREMVNVFREKMWLAEPETRDFFPKLVEFVDVWDKILADKLPGSIAPAIGHTEENLKPFYRHLEKVHDRLRSEVS
jgi:hypothetical protein